MPASNCKDFTREMVRFYREDEHYESNRRVVDDVIREMRDVIDASVG